MTNARSTCMTNGCHHSVAVACCLAIKVDFNPKYLSVMKEYKGEILLKIFSFWDFWIKNQECKKHELYSHSYSTSWGTRCPSGSNHSSDTCCTGSTVTCVNVSRPQRGPLYMHQRSQICYLKLQASFHSWLIYAYCYKFLHKVIFVSLGKNYHFSDEILKMFAILS